MQKPCKCPFRNPLSNNSYHMVTNQLIYNVNEFAGPNVVSAWIHVKPLYGMTCSYHLYGMTCSLHYHLFEHVITLKLVYKSFLVTCPLQWFRNLSPYFISFIVWIADIEQVSANDDLIIIALIINFTFFILLLSIAFIITVTIRF